MVSVERHETKNDEEGRLTSVDLVHEVERSWLEKRQRVSERR